MPERRFGRRRSLLQRAEEAFATNCAVSSGGRTHCVSFGATLEAYAAFHRRVFAPETPCAERRVLVVRESFSDVVGVGHAHMGLHRFLALGLALGRAVVFSHCSSATDPWAIRGRGIFKGAHPYDCNEPHLVFGEHYRGPHGIDLRWSEERIALFRGCGHTELALDLHSKALPQVEHVGQNPAALLRGCPADWVGCGAGWHSDQMACDVRVKAGCAELDLVLGDRQVVSLAPNSKWAYQPPRPPTRRAGAGKASGKGGGKASGGRRVGMAARRLPAGLAERLRQHMSEAERLTDAARATRHEAADAPTARGATASGDAAEWGGRMLHESGDAAEWGGRMLHEAASPVDFESDLPVSSRPWPRGNSSGRHVGRMR